MLMNCAPLRAQIRGPLLCWETQGKVSMPAHTLLAVFTSNAVGADRRQGRAVSSILSCTSLGLPKRYVPMILH